MAEKSINLNTWDSNKRNVPKEVLGGIEYASGPVYHGFDDVDVDQLRMKTSNEPQFINRSTK